MEREDYPILLMQQGMHGGGEPAPELRSTESGNTLPGPPNPTGREGGQEEYLERLQLAEKGQEDQEAGMMDRSTSQPLSSNLQPVERGSGSAYSLTNPQTMIKGDPANTGMTRGRALLGRRALSRGPQRMSLEVEDPGPALGRREEMTSGQTITFEEEDSDEKGSSNTSHMTQLALKMALQAEQIQLAQAKRALKRRSSPSLCGGARDHRPLHQ
jgi:hypothetical protein